MNPFAWKPDVASQMTSLESPYTPCTSLHSCCQGLRLTKMNQFQYGKLVWPTTRICGQAKRKRLAMIRQVSKTTIVRLRLTAQLGRRTCQRREALCKEDGQEQLVNHRRCVVGTHSKRLVLQYRKRQPISPLHWSWADIVGPATLDVFEKRLKPYISIDTAANGLAKRVPTSSSSLVPFATF